MAELPGTGPCEEKSDAPLFDEAMHLIQQRRQSLNFIDDDDAIFGCHFFSQALGTLAKGEIQGCVQQIVDAGTFEVLPDEETFPSLAGAKKKMGLLSQETV